MAAIDLHGIGLDYSIYNARARSLKHAITNLSIGGRLMRGQSDVVIVRALQNISFSLRDGDRLGLYGHNGSGKSSLLRVIAGIYPPTSGARLIRGNLSSLIDLAASVDVEASGIENIRQFAYSRGVPPRVVNQRIDSIVEFSELAAYMNLPMRTFSAGMHARLMFSIATEFDADIIVLDEWLAAGDQAFLEKTQVRMNTLVSSAKIVVFASHHIEQLRNVCNIICHLEHGQILYLGPTSGWDGPLHGQ